MLKLESLDAEKFKDIPEPCKCCLYWQTTGPYDEKALQQKVEFQKREWLTKATEEFGSCGSIAYFNDASIGFVQYGPAKLFPRAKEYASGPPSENSIFLACLFIADKDRRGKGLGTTMLRNVITELRRRGAKAVETFARKSSQNNPSGPLSLFLKQSFRIVSDADDFPLVRLDL